MEIDEVLAGNAAFTATGRFQGLRMMPRRQLLVIGCADPRVDPESVLGLELGDAAVVRNIGGRVTPPTLATLAGLATVGRLQMQASAGGPPMGSPGLDVVVLHHTDCGILRLAEDPNALAGFLGTDVEQVRAMHVGDPAAAIRHDVGVVRETVPGIRVWGLVYDVATGRVEIMARPEEVAA
ncbi:MAG TPA: carbonic anhydrase [Pseudonocardia sp.]